MAEADPPGKIFIGGLNLETKQKTLHIVFGRFGPIAHVILMRDRETKKSRGFAFITFRHPADAKNVIKEMNGVFLDGKKIKVEQAKRRSLESGGRRRLPSRGSSRILKCGRGRSSRERRPFRKGNLDNDGFARNFDMSSPQRYFGVKRSLSSKGEGLSPKRSARALTRSSAELRARESHGREISRNKPAREPVSSRRDEYPLRRDEGHSSKDSYSRRIYSRPQDTKEYASTSRGYHDYGCHSTRNEHASKVLSEHVGYSGGRDRDYSEYSSGSSYRDTYENYGSFREAPSTRGNYGGNNRYDDHYSSRDGYGGGRENYLSSRNDIYSSSYERSGRQGVFPPSDREYPEHGGRQRRHSPMDMLYSASYESYSSTSRFGGFSGGRGESRYESGDRY